MSCPNAKKKYPCPECKMCQWCSNIRCEMCQGWKVKPYQKSSTGKREACDCTGACKKTATGAAGEH